jgi:hypothetical protein
MRYKDIVEHARGSYSAEQAREIGDCAIVAMQEVTGLPWEMVFEAAKSRFSRTGLNSGDIAWTMRDLGWRTDGYNRGGWMTPQGVTVRRFEEWLQQNDPDVRLIAAIMVRGMLHSIAFVGGKFHNVQGAYKARVRLVSSCHRV